MQPANENPASQLGMQPANENPASQLGRFGHEIISTAIIFLLLIQVGLLSVTDESMGT